MFRLILACLLLSVPAYAKSTMSGIGVSTTGYVEAISATGAWLATQAEAEAGTNNDQIMTPLRTKQAIAAQATAGTTDRIVSGTASFTLASTGTITHASTASSILYMSGAGANSIELGQGRTTNNYAYIDFIGDATYTDYGLRIIRNNTGADASSWIQQRGNGGLYFVTTELAPLIFQMNGIERMRVHTNGFVGIGTNTPSSRLTVSSSDSYNAINVESPATGTADLGMSRGGERWWWSNRTSGLQMINSFDNGTTFNIPFQVLNNGNTGLSMTPSYRLDVNGTVRAAGDFITTSPNGMRMVQGNYGSFWRNDGTNLYQMITASGDQYGSWNGLRPLTINLASGAVTIGTTLTATNNMIEIQGTSPRMMFTDTDSNSRFWTYVDGTNYYVLADRDNNGSWEAPHPLQLNSANNTGLLFGQTIWTAGNSGSGSGLNADLLDGIDSTAFMRTGQTYGGDNALTIYGTLASNNSWSGGLEIREVNMVGSGQSASTYAPAITFHWGNTNVSSIKMYNDGSIRIKSGTDDANSYANLFSNNLWLTDAGDWITNVFMRRTANTWNVSSDGNSRFYYAANARTYIRANGGDGIIASFRGGDEVDKVHIAQDGNIYTAKLGIWLTDWFNQDLKTTANPTFNNIYLAYLGDWLSNRLDQSVKGNASPVFADGTAATTIYANGGIRLQRKSNASSPDTAGFVDFVQDGNYYVRQMYEPSTNQIAIRKSVAGGVGLLIQGPVSGIGAYNNLSDVRRKKDIQNIPYGLETIAKLHPVTFQWKEQVSDWQKGRKVGLIAQEVEKIVPEVVVTAKDPSRTKSIAYSDLVPVLIKSVQELKAENDQLKQNQKMLEQRLEALEKQAHTN